MTRIDWGVANCGKSDMCDAGSNSPFPQERTSQMGHPTIRSNPHG